MRSDHSNIRSVVLALFPWLAHFGLDDKRDLSIRSASTRLHLASADGREDPALHRVGDDGEGGTWSAALNVMTYTAPSGAVSAFTFTISAGNIVVARAGTGKIETKATTGSAKVTSG